MILGFLKNWVRESRRFRLRNLRPTPMAIHCCPAAAVSYSLARTWSYGDELYPEESDLNFKSFGVRFHELCEGWIISSSLALQYRWLNGGFKRNCSSTDGSPFSTSCTAAILFRQRIAAVVIFYDPDNVRERLRFYLTTSRSCAPYRS